jgi:hypothetical protein
MIRSSIPIIHIPAIESIGSVELSSEKTLYKAFEPSAGVSRGRGALAASIDVQNDAVFDTLRRLKRPGGRSFGRRDNNGTRVCTVYCMDDTGVFS